MLEIEAGDLIRDGKPAPRMQHLSEVAVLEVEVSAEDAERMEYVTKTKAAEWLDVSKPRITALISEGVLETKRFGRDELVSIASIDTFEKKRSQARPPEGRKGNCLGAPDQRCAFELSCFCDSAFKTSISFEF